MPDSSKTALILTGGGARAAYQVGVLSAIRDMLPDAKTNPFPIICGSSAGAINAASLATMSEDFDFAVTRLIEIWDNIHASDVYRTDVIGVAKTGLRWLGMLTGGLLAA